MKSKVDEARAAFEVTRTAFNESKRIHASKLDVGLAQARYMAAALNVEACEAEELAAFARAKADDARQVAEAHAVKVKAEKERALEKAAK